MVSLLVILSSITRVGLAVIGVNATNLISALQYCIHCVILNIAKATNAERISSGDVEDISILKQLSPEGQQTGYMELVSLFGILKSCNSHRMALPKLVFLGDDPTRFDRIAINGKELSITDVSRVVHQLRTMAANVLFKFMRAIRLLPTSQANGIR